VGFPHEDGAFRDLLEAAAQPIGLPTSLVEKDYWVSHTLWSLQRAGFELWFKGGTSLSKGFGLIERFSEDLDLKLARDDLPSVESWTSESTGRIARREAFFRALVERLPVLTEAGNALDEVQLDSRWRSANIHVRYPGEFSGELLEPNRGFVLLEVGHVRVTPFVERDLTSFVHDFLAGQSLIDDYDDNRPRSVRCVHPLVTLLEKLEAISRRFEAGHDPAGYVRHYEDAARIVGGDLPELDQAPAELYELMHGTRDLRRDLQVQDLAFTPGDDSAWQALGKAHAEIGHMFWGPRVSLAAACQAIRSWIDQNLPSA
jgi:Nucleotidyl transferase AbiEii toxin, Type IV TA system